MAAYFAQASIHLKPKFQRHLLKTTERKRLSRISPKHRVVRLFYRNGQARLEEHYIGDVLDGPRRTWYHNGTMHTEEFYRNDLLHGRFRQWTEDGRLLGSFTMDSGTGIQRKWFANGKPHMEISTVDGKFTGRTRVWLRDGTIVTDQYFVENRAVTRAEYTKAASVNPKYPTPGEESASELLSHEEAEEREYHLHLDWLLSREKKLREAKEWLIEGRGHVRSLSRFTHREACDLVEKLYRAGAKQLLAAEIHHSRKGKQFADIILVRLPTSEDKRRRLRTVFQKLPAAKRPWVMPEVDRGEKYLFVSLA